MSTVNISSPYLTINEVAEAMRVSKMTVYRLVQARALTSVRFGKSYRIPQNAFEEYLRNAGATAKP